MKKLIYIIIGIMLLTTACKTTEYVPVTTVKTVDRVKTEQVHDSVYLSDTVTITINEKGDTVRKDRKHIVYRDRWHEKIIKDSIHDSIPVPVKVNELTQSQTFQCSTYNYLLGAVIFLLSLLALIIFIWLKKRK